MTLDYFYGAQADQFAFYRIPKALFTDERFKSISAEAKILYGIEINDFAVTVAKTALWIAESQMMKETEDVVHMSLDFLPLKTNACIIEGNALRMDWESVVPKSRLNYIMGNEAVICGLTPEKACNFKEFAA